MNSVFCTQSKLNPLLLEAFELIKTKINLLNDLEHLEIDPKLSKIYRNVNNEELFIFNEFYQAKGFRKIHLEIAKLGKSLQILHCVFFPDPRYELPIFGADLIINSNSISAAIVDLSPVGKHLPEPLIARINALNRAIKGSGKSLPTGDKSTIAAEMLFELIIKSVPKIGSS